MSGKAGRVHKLVQGWAHGWEMFVEATRGPTDSLVGPNPWGQTSRGQAPGSDEHKKV